MIKPHYWPQIEFLSSRGQESQCLSWLSNNLSGLNLLFCMPGQPPSYYLEELMGFSWQVTLLCECLLIPLWEWLPMTSPSMNILFSLLKLWHLMQHISLPCFCGSYHFTLFEFWLPIPGYSECRDIFFTPPSPLTFHSGTLSPWPPVIDACLDPTHIIALWWVAQQETEEEGRVAVLN